MLKSPGSISTTRTPNRRTSKRRLSLIPSSANLLALYKTAEGQAQDTWKGTDIDDVSATLFAHDWQRSATYPKHAKEVGLHLSFCFFYRRVFDGAHQRKAGVVHYGIESVYISEQQRLLQR